MFNESSRTTSQFELKFPSENQILKRKSTPENSTGSYKSRRELHKTLHDFKIALKESWTTLIKKKKK